MSVFYAKHFFKSASSSFIIIRCVVAYAGKSFLFYRIRCYLLLMGSLKQLACCTIYYFFFVFIISFTSHHQMMIYYSSVEVKYCEKVIIYIISDTAFEKKCYGQNKKKIQINIAIFVLFYLLIGLWSVEFIRPSRFSFVLHMFYLIVRLYLLSFHNFTCECKLKYYI